MINYRPEFPGVSCKESIVSPVRYGANLFLNQKKISPVRDWQLTLHNWRHCRVKNHVTKN